MFLRSARRRLPAGQIALRERFEEAVIDDDPIPQRAEPARAPGTLEADETRHRIAVARDHNFLAGLRPGEKARELRLGLMDVHLNRKAAIP